MKIIVEAIDNGHIGVFASTDWENGTVVHDMEAEVDNFGPTMDFFFQNIPEIDGVLFIGPKELIDRIAAPLFEEDNDVDAEVIIQYTDIDYEEKEEIND